MFFEFFVTKLCFHDKPNQKNRKLRPVAFQRYRSELLALNSLRERFDERSHLEIVFRQAAMYSSVQRKTKGCSMLHQCSCYNDVASSLLDENKKQDLIFHRTVLEGYWELEARTGTVEKLLVSTFCFSGWVYHENTIS